MTLGAHVARLAAAILVGCLTSLLALAPAWSQEAIDTPRVTAQGVFAFDPATGEVILEEDADTRMPIGSITKVMTALVVMDHAGLDQTITITGDDMVGPGYSAMVLTPGDTLTVEQLLTGLLVVSGGDAARALARHVGGELAGTDDPGKAVDAFVEAMNEKAADLDLDDTRFANPDGEDSDDAWSTAHDVALMFAALHENPTLTAMAGEVSYEFSSVGPESTPYAGPSTNQLAGVDGVTSAKTGSTVVGCGCIVFARNGASGSTEIIAILGSNLEYDENWIATVDERWTDAQVVIEAIDSQWTPGQNLPATEPASAPEPTSAPGRDMPAETPPAVTLDDGDDRGVGPSTAPVLAATVAAGVIGLAGVLAWSRVRSHRKPGSSQSGYDTWP